MYAIGDPTDPDLVPGLELSEDGADNLLADLVALGKEGWRSALGGLTAARCKELKHETVGWPGAHLAAEAKYMERYGYDLYEQQLAFGDSWHRQKR